MDQDFLNRMPWYDAPFVPLEEDVMYFGEALLSEAPTDVNRSARLLAPILDRLANSADWRRLRTSIPRETTLCALIRRQGGLASQWREQGALFGSASIAKKHAPQRELRRFAAEVSDGPPETRSTAPWPSQPLRE
jgi:hypothetical protein